MTAGLTSRQDATERERCWQAVLARDSAADGRFYYAVVTTGIYCRPSCPARRAHRDNVRFYDDRRDAERAGFRPCRRCRPDQPSRDERQAGLVARACRIIEQWEETPRLTDLAGRVDLSPHHFQRLFKRITGLTPHQYAAARRGQRVRDELAGGASVTRAMTDAGYNSSGRFYAQADRALGMTPGRYRTGGAGTTIRFAVGESALGTILVAASDRGICAIFMGDDPEALTHDLQNRFPNAELIGGDADFEADVARVVGFVEAPALGLDLPLDIRGTAFQQRVWQALRAIPPGETATYAAVAERIGKPGAVRAVAGACAANKLAVAIPCHRVVRADGSLSGYRWGVERKRALLDRESGMRDE